MAGEATVGLLTLDEVHDREQREWIESFTWHLDQVPVLLQTMREMAIPLRAARLEGRITGGGYADNIPVSDAGPAVDSELIWRMLLEYVRAVTAFLNVDIVAPHAPDLPPLTRYPRVWSGPATVDSDPLTARRLALEAIGWLIDRAARIHDIDELDAYRAEFFTQIRRGRARYRNAGTSRRRSSSRVCGVCGACAVLVDWIDNPSGSPKPIQGGRCKVCGQVYLGGDR